MRQLYRRLRRVPGTFDDKCATSLQYDTITHSALYGNKTELTEQACIWAYSGTVNREMQMLPA